MRRRSPPVRLAVLATLIALGVVPALAPEAAAQETYEFRLDLEPKGQDLLNRITAAMETNQLDACDNTAADVGKRVLEQRWRDVATEQAFDLAWEIAKDGLKLMFPGSFAVQAGAEAADAVKNAVQSYLDREGPGGMLRRTGSQLSSLGAGELGGAAGKASEWIPEGYLASKTGGSAAREIYEAAAATDPPPLVEFPVQHDQCGEAWVRHWVLAPPIRGSDERYAAKLRYQISGDCEGRYPPRAQQRSYKLHEFQVDGRVDLDTRVSVDLTSFPSLFSHEVLVTYAVPGAGSHGAFDWEIQARCTGGTAPATDVAGADEAGAVGAGGDAEPADAEGPAEAEPRKSPREMAELVCERRCRDAYNAYADAADELADTRSLLRDSRRDRRDARAEADRAEEELEERERLEREREALMRRIDELGGDAPHPDREGTLADRIGEIDRDLDVNSRPERQLERTLEQARERAREAASDVETFREIYDRRKAALEEARAAYLACVEQCVDEAALGGAELTAEDVLVPGFPVNPPAGATDADDLPATPTPRTEPAPAPAGPAPSGSRAVVPDVAFAGGTISGTVVDPEGRPAASVPVEVATVSGVVVESRTDAEGEFSAEVPDEEGREGGPDGEEDVVRIAIDGLADELQARLVERLGREIGVEPPPFVQPDAEIQVVGDYPDAGLETPGQGTPGTEAPPETPGEGAETPGEGAETPGPETPAGADQPTPTDPTEEPPSAGAESGSWGPYAVERLEATGSLPLAVGRAAGPGGTPVVTAVRTPAELDPGQYDLVLVDPDGDARRYPTRLYRAEGWIDQETLNTGAETRFGMNFDFGEEDPPESVRMRLEVTGPIEVKDAGRYVELPVDASGRASYTGTLSARQGSLTGVPFSITPTIRR